MPWIQGYDSYSRSVRSGERAAGERVIFPANEPKVSERFLVEVLPSPQRVTEGTSEDLGKKSPF